MDKKNVLIGILIVLVLGLAVTTTYLFVDNQHKQEKIDVADQAADKAQGDEDSDQSDGSDNGGAAPDNGQSGTDGDSSGNGDSNGTVDDGSASTMEFFSDKGVEIRLYDWEKSKVLTSPATIRGEIPGNWSFEASFPVVLVNWDGLIIAEHYATVQGDWTTEDYVPFEVTLSFDTPTVYDRGALIIQKDNPSGLPEHADAIEIPVTLE